MRKTKNRIKNKPYTCPRIVFITFKALFFPNKHVMALIQPTSGTDVYILTGKKKP